MHLYDDPDNRFVAGFIGSPAMNFVAATVKDGAIIAPGLDNARLKPAIKMPENAVAVEIGLRPNALRLTEQGPYRVEHAENLGAVTYAHLTAPSGERLVVETDQRLPAAGGTMVGLEYDPADCFVFRADNGLRVR
jgi:lactose/L-arabinose transport system ATP-binding protein